MEPTSISRNDRGRRCFLTALLLMSTGSAMAEIEERIADQFRAAMLAYERNHWPEAHAGLVVLADQGHAEASRIAMVIARLPSGQLQRRRQLA